MSLILMFILLSVHINSGNTWGQSGGQSAVLVITDHGGDLL